VRDGDGISRVEFGHELLEEIVGSRGFLVYGVVREQAGTERERKVPFFWIFRSRKEKAAVYPISHGFTRWHLCLLSGLQLTRGYKGPSLAN